MTDGSVGDEREDFETFLRTGMPNLDPDRSFGPQWVPLVKDAVARGVVMRRARIVSEPVTDHIRYEHAITPLNLQAGEDVRWLPVGMRALSLCPATTSGSWTNDSCSSTTSPAPATGRRPARSAPATRPPSRCAPPRSRRCGNAASRTRSTPAAEQPVTASPSSSAQAAREALARALEAAARDAGLTGKELAGDAQVHRGQDQADAERLEAHQRFQPGHELGSLPRYPDAAERRADGERLRRALRTPQPVSAGYVSARRYRAGRGGN